MIFDINIVHLLTKKAVYSLSIQVQTKFKIKYLNCFKLIDCKVLNRESGTLLIALIIQLQQ